MKLFVKTFNLAILVLITLSCSEQDEVLPELTDQLLTEKILEAQDFFENRFEPDEEENYTNARNAKQKRHSLKKNLQWNKSYIRKLSEDNEGLVIPVQFEEDIYVKQTDSPISLSDLTYILYSEDERGKEKFEVVTTFPDSTYLASDNRDKTFSGRVYVESWNGKLLKSITHKYGNITLYEVEESANARIEYCETVTDWYVCVSVDGGDSWGCSYQETEVTIGLCDNNDAGGGTGYNYEPATCTSCGSGSSSGGEPDASDDDLVEVCDKKGYISDGKGGCVEAIVVISPDTPIADMAKYLECFNVSQSATITIYANQPIANSSATHDGTLVGHTFVSISQNGNRSVFGFYPATSNVYPIVNPSDPSAMGNDSNDPYNVSVSTTVSGSELSQIINYSTNYQSTYHLDDYNCSDFGIEIGNLAGLGLPACNGTWPGGGGSNPGTLGQYLRNMTLPNGATRNTTGGNAPSNNKGC